MNPRIPQFSNRTFSWKSGKQWFDAGVLLFKQVKTQWYMTCILLGLFLIVLGNVSTEVVALAMVFASPLITAYMMICCQQADRIQGVSWLQLWPSVLQHFQPLMLLGLITAGLSLVFNYLHLQILQAYNMPVELTEELVKNMSGRESLFRALLNLVTNLPVILALAFSPALIVFRQTRPFTAIQLSIKGVGRSWRAFVAMTLIFLLLFFAIMLAVSLMLTVIMTLMGSASPMIINLLVLFFLVTAGGIGLCAQYQAYTELFEPDNGSDSDSEDDDGTEVYAEI